MRANEIRLRAQALREEMLAVYPDYDTWTSLDKHAFAFGEREPDGQVKFSSNTIIATVQNQGASKPGITGVAVNAFNSFVSDQCPIGKKVFSTPGQSNNYKPKLHAGTFEIFNEDGSTNAEMLAKIERLTDHETGNVALSTLQAALKIKVGDNARVSETRHDHNFFSRGIEAFSNGFAWGAVFEMLVCHWQKNPNKPAELEPCVDPKLLSLFFVDTPICFKIAKEIGCPRHQPTMEKTSCLRCC